mgnify:CR=1 FL=1
MNKLKIVSFLVIVMLIVNIAIISYIILNNKAYPADSKRRMPREIVIEKLGFNSDQIATYDVTIKRHQNKIKSLDDAIRNTKNELYSHLKDNSTEIDTNDSLVLALGNYQKEIEITHFNHFIEIKKICTPDQMDEFNNLTEELSKIFSHPRRPKHER